MLVAELRAMAPLSGAAVISNTQTPPADIGVWSINCLPESRWSPALKRRSRGRLNSLTRLQICLSDPCRCPPAPYTNSQILHANSLRDTNQTCFQFFTSLKKDMPTVLTQKLVYKNNPFLNYLDFTHKNITLTISNLHNYNCGKPEFKQNSKLPRTGLDKQKNKREDADPISHSLAC